MKFGEEKKKKGKGRGKSGNAGGFGGVTGNDVQRLITDVGFTPAALAQLQSDIAGIQGFQMNEEAMDQIQEAATDAEQAAQDALIAANAAAVAAQEAAAAAEVLPVEAHIIASDPSSTAFVTAMAMPRSLNEPVGLRPSYLI